MSRFPSKTRCIGVLTSGGDCPGLNAAIRGITKAAIQDYGIKVVGILDGLNVGPYEIVPELNDDVLRDARAVLEARVDSNVWIVDADGVLLSQSEHSEMVLNELPRAGEAAPEGCLDCHVSFAYLEEILEQKRGTTSYQLRDSAKKLTAYEPMQFLNVTWIVAVNSSYDSVTAFITQKITFKAGTTHMRPGQLVTVVKNNKNYALLFLHLASGSNPRGMGLRDEMLERAFEFRRKLDKAEGGAGKARYVFLGDLNTMGLKYPFKKSIDADTEIRKWDKYAGRKKIKMHRLDKTHPFSWSNGSNSRYKPSSLDHVYASDNLKFKKFGGTNAEPQLVAVRGWVEEPSVAREDKWIERFSDHSLLYFEIHD